MNLAAPVVVSRNTNLGEQTLRISAELARNLQLTEGTR